MEIAMIPRIRRALKVQPVELIGTALQKLLGGKILQRMDDNIICLHRIWNCRDCAVGRCDILGKIVDHPVRQILDAV
jgi:hypothetical protein